MADRPNPYIRKDPGDIIRSGDWNELQIKAREEIYSHNHSGGDKGTQISGAGIDPKSDVTINSLITNDLTIKGKAILGDIQNLLDTVKSLNNNKVNKAGDTITGALTINSDLTVTGSLTAKNISIDGKSLAFSTDLNNLKTSIDNKVNKAGDTLTGNLTVNAAIYAGNSDLYFTKTNHNHSGIGNTQGYAAIENATDYGALMILGRQVDKTRVVKLWDYLEVNGNSKVTGQLEVQGRRLYPKIKVYRDQICRNGGTNIEGKWSINIQGEFNEVYDAYVVLQGHSLWGAFGTGYHGSSSDCIPQMVYAKLTTVNTSLVSGVGYCSESRADYEGDNSVMFTVVIIGA